MGLGGSSHPHSTPIAALDAALAGARTAGAETQRFDIYTLDLPMYEYGTCPPAVEPFIEAVRWADGLIWCSPLYHGTVAGSFKNAIDWLQLLAKDDPPYLTNKVVGLIATAGGAQALQAINTMEFIVRSLRGWTLPLTAPILHSETQFDHLGNPLDPKLESLLQSIGTEVARAASKLAK